MGTEAKGTSAKGTQAMGAPVSGTAEEGAGSRRSTGRRWLEGWIVFRVTPWAVHGPIAQFDDAVTRADAMGPAFCIAYGLRENGTVDFLPLLEPVGLS